MLSRKTSASAVLKSTRHSWNVFSSSILCMVTAGTVYWFPALGQGLSTHLKLSEGEITTVLAAVNTGSLFGFIGGMLYRRVGSKRTTILASLCVSLSYFGLGFLVRYQSKNAFPVVVCLAVCMVTASYAVYSTAMATAAAAFPKAQRGRIMGFLTAMFGMSGGVCGVLQAAFFPTIQHTEHLLYFVAILTATPIAIAVFLFPDSSTAVSASTRAASSGTESTPLISTASEGIARRAPVPERSTSTSPSSVAKLIAVTYAIAVAIVADLQFGAYAAWTNSVRIALPDLLANWALEMGIPPILRAEVLCALILVMLLFSFAFLPFCFRESEYPSRASLGIEASEEETVEDAAMPFRDVVHDFRFHLLVLAFFILPGCGSITTLVQATGVVASRMLPGFHNESVPSTVATGDSIGRAVRALIVAFSACNMMARLIAGAIADVGGSAIKRESWKLRVLQFDIVLMTCAMLGVAFAKAWTLIITVGAVGFAHGTFFAITPTQASNWFGVDGFPLNFAVAGIGVSVASVSVSSWVTTLVAGYVMKSNWIEVTLSPSHDVTQKFCSGLMCYAPTFLTVALMNCALLGAYMVMHKRIVFVSVKLRCSR